LLAHIINLENQLAELRETAENTQEQEQKLEKELSRLRKEQEEKEKELEKQLKVVDERAKNAWVINKGNCSEVYFKYAIWKILVNKLFMAERQANAEVEKVWKEMLRRKKGDLNPIDLVELVNKILLEYGYPQISFDLSQISENSAYKFFKNLPENISNNLAIVEATENGWHIIIVEGVVVDERTQKVYIKVRESNVDGKGRIVKKDLAESIIKKLGEIILISESRDTKTVREEEATEISSRNKEKVEERGGDTRGIGSASKDSAPGKTNQANNSANQNHAVNQLIDGRQGGFGSAAGESFSADGVQSEANRAQSEARQILDEAEQELAEVGRALENRPEARALAENRLQAAEQALSKAKQALAEASVPATPGVDSLGGETAQGSAGIDLMSGAEGQVGGETAQGNADSSLFNFSKKDNKLNRLFNQLRENLQNKSKVFFSEVHNLKLTLGWFIHNVLPTLAEEGFKDLITEAVNGEAEKDINRLYEELEINTSDRLEDKRNQIRAAILSGKYPNITANFDWLGKRADFIDLIIVAHENGIKLHGVTSVEMGKVKGIDIFHSVLGVKENMLKKSKQLLSENKKIVGYTGMIHSQMHPGKVYYAVNSLGVDYIMIGNNKIKVSNGKEDYDAMPFCGINFSVIPELSDGKYLSVRLFIGNIEDLLKTKYNQVREEADHIKDLMKGKQIEKDSTGNEITIAIPADKVDAGNFGASLMNGRRSVSAFTTVEVDNTPARERDESASIPAGRGQSPEKAGEEAVPGTVPVAQQSGRRSESVYNDKSPKFNVQRPTSENGRNKNEDKGRKAEAVPAESTSGRTSVNVYTRDDSASQGLKEHLRRISGTAKDLFFRLSSRLQLRLSKIKDTIMRNAPPLVSTIMLKLFPWLNKGGKNAKDTKNVPNEKKDGKFKNSIRDAGDTPSSKETGKSNSRETGTTEQLKRHNLRLSVLINFFRRIEKLLPAAVKNQLEKIIEEINRQLEYRVDSGKITGPPAVAYYDEISGKIVYNIDLNKLEVKTAKFIKNHENLHKNYPSLSEEAVLITQIRQLVADGSRHSRLPNDHDGASATPSFNKGSARRLPALVGALMSFIKSLTQSAKRIAHSAKGGFLPWHHKLFPNLHLATLWQPATGQSLPQPETSKTESTTFLSTQTEGLKNKLRITLSRWLGWLQRKLGQLLKAVTPRSPPLKSTQQGSADLKRILFHLFITVQFFQKLFQFLNLTKVPEEAFENIQLAAAEINMIPVILLGLGALAFMRKMPFTAICALMIALDNWISLHVFGGFWRDHGSNLLIDFPYFASLGLAIVEIGRLVLNNGKMARVLKNKVILLGSAAAFIFLVLTQIFPETAYKTWRIFNTSNLRYTEITGDSLDVIFFTLGMIIYFPLFIWARKKSVELSNKYNILSKDFWSEDDDEQGHFITAKGMFEAVNGYEKDEPYVASWFKELAEALEILEKHLQDVKMAGKINKLPVAYRKENGQAAWNLSEEEIRDILRVNGYKADQTDFILIQIEIHESYPSEEKAVEAQAKTLKADTNKFVTFNEVSYEDFYKLLFKWWLKFGQNRDINSFIKFAPITDRVTFTEAYNCLILLLVNSRNEKWWGAHFADPLLQRGDFSAFIEKVKEQVKGNGKDYRLYLFDLAAEVSSPIEEIKDKVLNSFASLGVTDYIDLTGASFGGGIADVNNKEFTYSYGEGNNWRISINQHATALGSLFYGLLLRNRFLIRQGLDIFRAFIKEHGLILGPPLALIRPIATPTYYNLAFRNLSPKYQKAIDTHEQYHRDHPKASEKEAYKEEIKIAEVNEVEEPKKERKEKSEERKKEKIESKEVKLRGELQTVEEELETVETKIKKYTEKIEGFIKNSSEKVSLKKEREELEEEKEKLLKKQKELLVKVEKAEKSYLDNRIAIEVINSYTEWLENNSKATTFKRIKKVFELLQDWIFAEIGRKLALKEIDNEFIGGLVDFVVKTYTVAEEKAGQSRAKSDKEELREEVEKEFKKLLADKEKLLEKINKATEKFDLGSIIKETILDGQDQEQKNILDLFLRNKGTNYREDIGTLALIKLKIAWAKYEWERYRKSSKEEIRKLQKEHKDYQERLQKYPQAIYEEIIKYFPELKDPENGNKIKEALKYLGSPKVLKKAAMIAGLILTAGLAAAVMANNSTDSNSVLQNYDYDNDNDLLTQDYSQFDPVSPVLSETESRVEPSMEKVKEMVPAGVPAEKEKSEVKEAAVETGSGSGAGVPAKADEVKRDDPETQVVVREEESKKPLELTPTTGLDPPAEAGQKSTPAVEVDSQLSKDSVGGSGEWSFKVPLSANYMFYYPDKNSTVNYYDVNLGLLFANRDNKALSVKFRDYYSTRAVGVGFKSNNFSTNIIGSKNKKSGQKFYNINLGGKVGPVSGYTSVLNRNNTFTSNSRVGINTDAYSFYVNARTNKDKVTNSRFSGVVKPGFGQLRFNLNNFYFTDEKISKVKSWNARWNSKWVEASASQSVYRDIGLKHFQLFVPVSINENKFGVSGSVYRSELPLYWYSEKDGGMREEVIWYTMGGVKFRYNSTANNKVNLLVQAAVGPNSSVYRSALSLKSRDLGWGQNGGSLWGDIVYDKNEIHNLNTGLDISFSDYSGIKVHYKADPYYKVMGGEWKTLNLFKVWEVKTGAERYKYESSSGWNWSPYLTLDNGRMFIKAEVGDIRKRIEFGTHGNSFDISIGGYQYPSGDYGINFTFSTRNLLKMFENFNPFKGSSTKQSYAPQSHSYSLNNYYDLERAVKRSEERIREERDKLPEIDKLPEDKSTKSSKLKSAAVTTDIDADAEALDEALSAADKEIQELFKEITGIELDGSTDMMTGLKDGIVTSFREYDWDEDGKTDYIYKYVNLGNTSEERAAKYIESLRNLDNFRKQLSFGTKGKLESITTPPIDFISFTDAILRFKQGNKFVEYYVYEYVFTLLYDEEGNFRGVDSAVDFLTAIADFHDALVNSKEYENLSILIKEVFDINFSDGLELAEINKLGNPDGNILYDEAGELKQAEDAAGFLKLANYFREAFSQKAASEQANIDAILSYAFEGLNLADGLRAGELNILGNPDYGIIYKQENDPRFTTLAGAKEAVQFYLDVYKFKQASTPESDELLNQVFGIKLLDGITARELQVLGDKDNGILYDQDGNLRDPA
ncbi:MAG: DNA-binding protein, partial [Candidatus Omnitrophica bacterium]|nr:DNA-binding protein [Candidatus Omnitrophota bacterium]